MNELTQVELTTTQRDLLLRGLQFVRSSVKLSLGESRLPDDQRSDQLEAIETLEQQLREDLASQPSTNLS
ncbi:MAG TPA: hypothetical protein DCE43_06350 [Planctomycetaceae bacterium]|jgi:hypothetical protein|nr:hypothetical protein [Planctomycetaceae bacterium]HAA49323.1 hypothetical protein [Planctomycetaceae bacterium]HCK54691.1 hypothetical protein [Planctomycetaceae bacterium]|tara:strand:- start:212 stop:421 length:210 start_codon:yes stop_codon:yes gene_type:complete